MNKKINIGIIGAGKIVESIHLPVLLNIPEVSVQWIFDKDERRSALLSQMYGVERIDANGLDTSIAATDLCLIAVPYGVRDAYIRTCAAMKKAVYVEKPFATTVAQHNGYCNLFAPPDIAIGFQRRYYKFVSDIGKMISSGMFGNIKAINFNQGYFQLKGGSGFMSDARLSGGGVIIESAIHTLDQLLQFTKAGSLEVNDVHSLSRLGIDYDTKFTTTLSCDGLSFPVHSHISTVRNLDNGITIEFENKTVQFQPSVNTILYSKGQQEKNFSELMLPADPGANCESVNASFVQFWKDFITAIQIRETNQTNAVNSMLTTMWIEQIYQQVNSAPA